MPGSELCARCATSLGLATAVIDVHPPRAGSRARLVRRLSSLRKTWFPIRDALHAPAVREWARSPELSLNPAYLLVPGWAHFLIGQKWKGHLFLWGYLACVLLWISMYGTGWGSMWLGMAFSVHSSAAFDIVNQDYPQAPTATRMRYSITVSLLLGAVLYLPCLLVLGEFAQPHRVHTGMATLQFGDVIVVNRWPTPKRGDVVLYSTDSGYNVPYTGPWGERARIYAGENIDRVLATPGDKVQCASGQLIVNGAPSPWLPLNPRPLPDSFTWTVPTGHYLILPSGVPGTPNLKDANVWQGMGCVDRQQITGRAYLRSYPLSRFQVIH